MTRYICISLQIQAIGKKQFRRPDTDFLQERPWRRRQQAFYAQ